MENNSIRIDLNFEELELLHPMQIYVVARYLNSSAGTHPKKLGYITIDFRSLMESYEN